MATETGQEDAKTLEEVQAKVEDLNKGIAKYRDTAQAAETKAAVAEAKAAAAEKAAEDLRKEIEAGKDSKDDKEVKLNESDQKRLEAWAKQQGFVTKTEMEAQKITLFQESIQGAEKQAVEEFLDRHPEYSEKDRWDEVKKQFEQYKQPTSLTGYRSLLNKIHRELSEDEDKAAEVRAKEEQKKRLGLGGQGNASDNSEGSMTMEILRERYPNLSEDQITNRLAEINEIAVERAKKAARQNK